MHQFNICGFCIKKSVLIDAASFKWCVDHRHRGDLLNAGAKLGYPDLHCRPYAIGPGKDCWIIAAMAGQDEMIHHFLAAIKQSQNGMATT